MDVFQLKKVVDIINKHGIEKRIGNLSGSAIMTLHNNGNKYELSKEAIATWDNKTQLPSMILKQNLVIRYNLLSVYEKISWEIFPRQEQPPQYKINHPKLAIKAIYSLILIRKYA